MAVYQACRFALLLWLESGELAEDRMGWRASHARCHKLLERSLRFRTEVVQCLNLDASL
jgi:hypothetical protein